MRLFEFAFYLPKKLVSVDSSSSPISLVEESPTHSANTAGREIFELRSSGRLTGYPHLTACRSDRSRHTAAERWIWQSRPLPFKWQDWVALGGRISSYRWQD